MSDDDERFAARVRDAAAQVHASPALRAAVARERLGSAPAPREPRRRWPILAGLGVAALLAAVVAIAGIGGATDPTVADAVQTALRAPTSPPPTAIGGHLRLAVGGVAFPDYGGSGDWRAIGTRTDDLGGRKARTVVYGRGAERAGYTIVDGAPLAVPAGSRRMVYDGTPVAVVDHSGFRYITWRRGGHTCVLATQGTGVSALLALTSSRH